MEENEIRERLKYLNNIELDILRAICSGKSINEIAYRLDHSLKWVSYRINVIYKKLGIAEPHTRDCKNILIEKICPHVQEKS